jgi:hypothetical protein
MDSATYAKKLSEIFGLEFLPVEIGSITTYRASLAGKKYYNKGADELEKTLRAFADSCADFAFRDSIRVTPEAYDYSAAIHLGQAQSSTLLKLEKKSGDIQQAIEHFSDHERKTREAVSSPGEETQGAVDWMDELIRQSATRTRRGRQ